MAKTLVNIITDDNPIPAYLFIKEMYQSGDRVMYISAKDTRDDLEQLAEVDGLTADVIDEIVLKEDIDEFRYEKICQTIKKYLKEDVFYCVNLTGGTRYMALAVQQVFEDYQANFYYVNLEDNTLVRSKFDDSIYDGDDIVTPIAYRMGVDEYLRIHDMDTNLQSKSHEPIRPYEYAVHMYTLFREDKLSHIVLNTLRENYSTIKKVKISELEKPKKLGWIAIPRLAYFLETIQFQESEKGYLNHREIQYLIGGWLEEYMYYQIKNIVKPQDIVISTTITRKDTGMHHQNELDVVLTKGNKLFVIECKTGVESEKKFNEIVYKACSLKEALLGVSCYSFIASLKVDETGELKKIAQYMGLEFWDSPIMKNNSKFANQLHELVTIAKD